MASFIAALFWVATGIAQTGIPAGNGGFENATSTFAANGWSEALPGVGRQWRVGATAGSVAGGTQAAYLGNAANYNGANTAQVGHFYRDVVIPTGATNVMLNFSLRMPTVDPPNYDYFRVYTTTTSNTPVSGTSGGAGYTLRFENVATDYANFTAMPAIDLTALAGTTIRLVFTNVSDGVAPHANPAVDNVTLNYTPNSPCTGTPSGGTVPATLSTCPNGAVNITASGAGGNGTGVTMQWEEFNGSIWVPAVGGSGAGTTTYTTPPLTGPKQYRLSVTCTSVGGGTATSNPCAVTPALSPVCYCGGVLPGAGFDDATGIRNVTFNTINNTSNGGPAYTNFTAVQTTVNAGQVYPLTVYVNTGGDFTVLTKAWIDWDQNSVFDPSEEYDMGSATNGNPVLTSSSPLNITVPVGALGGATIMRVRTADDFNLDGTTACDDLDYTEAEDYTVNVIPCTPPTAVLSLVNDCGNNQYSISIDVNAYGSGSQANVVYSVDGGTPITLNNVGLAPFNIGPFGSASVVSVSVNNGPVACAAPNTVFYSGCPIEITCGNTLIVDHCYGNFDPRTWTFISSSPFETVTVTFVGGTMDPNDVIRGYSGTDNTGAPIAGLTGTFATLAGVSGASTGPELYLEIDSDAGNSCASGQQSSWNFEAECTAGCVDPDATITVNNDCPAYNFNIDVDVVYTGDGATTTLQYTVNGGSPQLMPGLVDGSQPPFIPSSVNIGPFNIGDVVNIRLLHETDPACDHNFGNFTNTVICPSAENCVNALNLATQTSPLPGTTIGRVNDFSIACGTASTNTALDAIYYIDVPDGQQLSIRQQSNTYDSQHYVRYGGACPGTIVIACVDDDDAEVGWVYWTNSTGSTQRVWWIQDGFGAGTGNFVLEWALVTCPVPIATAATGVTNAQANANFTAPAGNYIVEWGPAATFTSPGAGLAPGTNGTVILSSTSPVLISGLAATTQYRYFVRRDCGGGNFSTNSSAILFNTTNAPTLVANGACGNNVAIPDNGCGTSTNMNATIAITGQPNALGTNVGLASVDLIVTHSFRADLTMTLTSPGGQSVVLVDQRGGSDNNFGVNGTCPAAVFTLIAGGAALNTIPASNNVTGNYTPEFPLTGFNTGDPNGNWLLQICDHANIDVGGLRYVQLNFLPLDCLGALNGPAMPGTACNDGDACTINDTWSPGCMCVGTFQDTDGDGTCNANDGCPNDPNKIAPGQCGCGNPDTDTDGDLTADCNDLCPNDPNKIAPGQCGCGNPDTDTDGDLTADCNDICPTVANGNPGDPCDDLDPFTFNDMLGASTACSCAGTACTETVTIEMGTDGTGLRWTLRDAGNNTVVQSSPGYPAYDYPPASPNYTVTTCLPDGSFYFVFEDENCDGIVGGGYIVRVGGVRVIDNRTNLSGCPSQITGNMGVNVPVGNDRLITQNTDRLDLRRGVNGTCSDKLTANDTYGLSPIYQFWFYAPNGGLSFTYPASGPGSNVVSMASLPSLIDGTIYNVRVRSWDGAQWRAWGPAGRMRIDNPLGQCKITSLFDDTSSPNHSCGKTIALPLGNQGNSAANRITAWPVTRFNNNCVSVNANKYQFRFRNIAENVVIVRTSSSYHTFMTTGAGFEPCEPYDVEVRASFDGGATWCTGGADPYNDLTPWGEICAVNTGGCSSAGGNQNIAIQHGGNEPVEVRMYPNPNRGDQLYLALDKVSEGVNTVSVDIYDLFGKRVSARTIAVQDGFINTVLELNGELAAGMYMVNITAGAHTYTERLVIQP